MKKIFPFLTLAFLLTVCSIQAEAEENGSRNFPVKDFSGIQITGNFKVFLYQAETPYLKVKAPSDDIYDALEVESGGGTLSVSTNKRILNLNRTELHIGFRQLDDIRCSGGLKVVSDGYLEVNQLNIFSEGSVNMDMKLKASSLEVTCNGGGIFNLSGVTGNLSVKVAGAGHVNARDLVAKEVTFRVGGVGFGSVHATGLLDVKIEGVGKVTYKGNPDVKRIVQGLGSVVEYEESTDRNP